MKLKKVILNCGNTFSGLFWWLSKCQNSRIYLKLYNNNVKVFPVTFDHCNAALLNDIFFVLVHNVITWVKTWKSPFVDICSGMHGGKKGFILSHLLEIFLFRCPCVITLECLFQFLNMFIYVCVSFWC